MDDSEAYRLFDALWADVLDEEQVFIRRPFLAHYTSLLGPIGLRGQLLLEVLSRKSLRPSLS